MSGDVTVPFGCRLLKGVVSLFVEKAEPAHAQSAQGQRYGRQHRYLARLDSRWSCSGEAGDFMKLHVKGHQPLENT